MAIGKLTFEVEGEFEKVSDLKAAVLQRLSIQAADQARLKVIYKGKSRADTEAITQDWPNSKIMILGVSLMTTTEANDMMSTGSSDSINDAIVLRTVSDGVQSSAMVTVRQSGKRIYKVETDFALNAGELRRCLANHLNVPPSYLRLLAKGRELEDADPFLVSSTDFIKEVQLLFSAANHSSKEAAVDLDVWEAKINKMEKVCRLGGIVLKNDTINELHIIKDSLNSDAQIETCNRLIARVIGMKDNR